VKDIFDKVEEYNKKSQSLSDLDSEIRRDVEPIENHIATILGQKFVSYDPKTNQVELMNYTRDFIPSTSMLYKLQEYLKAKDSHFQVEKDKYNHGSKGVIYLKYD
jgi:hypothetical protein